jgi:hypothetical protein
VTSDDPEAYPHMNPTLTAAAALQQAIQLYGAKHLNPKDVTNPIWLTAAQTAIENAAIGVTGGLGPDCQGQTAQPLNLLKTVSGLSLGTATGVTTTLASADLIPAAAVPVIGWIVAGVGAIIGLIIAIFQHHAQAVARDLQFGCSAIPAVNNAFAVVIQAVQQGTMSPTDAANALPQIYTSYMAAGGASGSLSGPGSIPGGGTPINDSPFCNSNCELSVVVLAMVFYWQSQFLAQAQPAGILSLLGGSSSAQSLSGGSGGLLLLVIIIALLAAAL